MATIRTASDRITATVAAHGHIKQGQYGEYQSVLFESPNLPDGKVWRAMEPDQAQQFCRGQHVYLVPTTNKQGKPSFDIEILDAPAPTAPQSQVAPTAPTAPTTAPGTIPNDKKPEIAAYATDMAKLYAYCYSQAIAAMPESAPMDAIQAAASSVFIQASRKFSL